MEQQKNKAQQTLSIQSKTKGILWGAVLGDVIGAKLQFSSDFSKENIDAAFSIKGGGVHKLQPGQPTDDSQLSYAIAKGLQNGNGVLNLNLIAQQMGNWFLSKPIDVGGTIRKAVPKACNMKYHQAHLCRKGAKQGSQASQSNGTLMAISPLGIWTYKLSPLQIIQCVRQYTILIHPNETVVLTNTFFILAISYLLNNPQDQRNINAYQFAKNNLKNKFNDQFTEWIKFLDKAIENFQFLIKQLPANKKSGWIRIAFTYSFYFLIKGKSFQSSLRMIIQLKGDTDTNACIAGGILGAYYGIQNIKLDKQIQLISLWRPKKVKRPDWMVPGIIVQKLAKKLFILAPQKLIIVGSQKQYQEKNKK